MNSIVKAALTDGNVSNGAWITEYIEAIRIIARMVKEAKPSVEAEARMMADLTRFAPLSPEEQAKHDGTEFPCERWMKEYESYTEE